MSNIPPRNPAHHPFESYDTPLAYSYEEAAAILRLPAGARTIRTLVATGRLARTKVGHYNRISDEELRDFIARNTTGTVRR